MITKRLFAVIALSLYIAAAASVCYFIADKIYYRNSVPYLSPIEFGKKIQFKIRKDQKGDGRFGAPRNGNRLHKGIDLEAPIKTPVRAVRSGIAIPRIDKEGYGNYVEIYHENGLMTLYAHLSRVYIKPGINKVYQGQIIGLVGSTGNAKYKGIAAHLHFEVKRNGESIDPGLILYRERAPVKKTNGY